ncbi:hypothetical protein BTW00_03630 [Psychrobacter sp. C 20.9]|nr:hypothetical protein BTW00_03630 [Psychrobacter sp. C 20.9]
MLNRPNTTQQINTYLRSQQLLYRHLQLCQRIKKADRSRQEVSAFNNNEINLTKVNSFNQITHGVNQYVTV